MQDGKRYFSNSPNESIPPQEMTELKLLNASETHKLVLLGICILSDTADPILQIFTYSGTNPSTILEFTATTPALYVVGQSVLTSDFFNI
jgi:hypothetical protein